MLPDRVSNPGPLTYESGALPIALRGPDGCGIRKLLFVALRYHTNKNVRHCAILISCSFTEVLELGILYGNSSRVLWWRSSPAIPVCVFQFL